MRVVIAGIVGAIVMFLLGAVEHMALEWETRTMPGLPHEESFVLFIKPLNLKPGFYSFPYETEDPQAKDALEKLNEKFKAGPNGQLIIGPTGEDMMGTKQLGGEFGLGLVATCLAAWIVSQLRESAGMGQAWFTCVAIGAIGWFCISGSYWLWYRFSWEFTRDALFCNLFEWAITGAVIVAIVRRRSTPPAKSAE